jgi:Tol biopolymer transport system component
MKKTLFFVRLPSVVFVSFVLFVLASSCVISGCQKIPQSDIAPIDFLFPLGDPPANNILWSPVEPDKILVSAGYSNFSGGEIYIFDISQNKKQIIARSDSGFIGIRTWFPDGEAFIMSTTSATDIVDASGLWRVNLINNTFSYLQSETDQAIFGPDRNSITISKTRNLMPDMEETVLVKVNTQNHEENLVYEAEVGKVILGFSWSPDGTQLAFAMGDFDAQSSFNIYIFDAYSQKVFQITFDGNNTYPTWSPKGNLIAYRQKKINQNQSVSYSINLVNPNGSCNIKILESDYVLPPSWSPNGAQLAFIIPNLGGVYMANITKLLNEGHENFCK